MQYHYSLGKFTFEESLDTIENCHKCRFSPSYMYIKIITTLAALQVPFLILKIFVIVGYSVKEKMSLSHEPM